MSRGAAAEAMALPLARSCRAAGLAVELHLSGAAFGKQFKRADRSGARWVAVIGEAEAAEGVVVLREMRVQAAMEGREQDPGEERIPPERVSAVLRGKGEGG